MNAIFQIRKPLKMFQAKGSKEPALISNVKVTQLSAKHERDVGFISLSVAAYVI